MITGVGVTLVSDDVGSAVGFFTGSAIAGVGFGSGCQGGTRLIGLLTSRPRERPRGHDSPPLTQEPPPAAEHRPKGTDP